MASAPRLLTIRQAAPEDVPELLRMVKALAIESHLREYAVATEEGVRRMLFAQPPAHEAWMACVNGQVVGFLSCFTCYGLWQDGPMIWMENIYLHPQQRRRGFGRRLMEHLAGIARERGCSVVVWRAEASNRAGLEFYKSLGAQASPQLIWHDWRPEVFGKMSRQAV